MKKLKDLVPPLELCKQIPVGELNDTALVWICIGQVENKDDWMVIANNDALIYKLGGHHKTYAPTLQEIMEVLYGITGRSSVFSIHDVIGWHVCYRGEDIFDEESAAAAALKLWLQVCKKEKANETLSHKQSQVPTKTELKRLLNR